MKLTYLRLVAIALVATCCMSLLAPVTMAAPVPWTALVDVYAHIHKNSSNEIVCTATTIIRAGYELELTAELYRWDFGTWNLVDDWSGDMVSPRFSSIEGKHPAMPGALYVNKVTARAYENSVLIDECIISTGVIVG